MTRSEWAARVFTIGIGLVAGAGVGFVLTFTHRQYVVSIAGVPIPFGLIGALAIVAALLIGMRLAFGERTPTIAAAAGVIVASALLMIPTRSGSMLALEDPPSYVWALGPTVLAIVIIGWPSRRRVRRVRRA